MLTGERTVPGRVRENYWFRRHEAAYGWVIGQIAVPGKTIVDAGSGEGYGAQSLLDAGAAEVIALEYDEAAARHSAARYPGVRTLRCNLDAMPVAPGSADVLVTMQVIEHLWDLPAFLRQCRAILRPGGLLVAATPNRLTFSPGLGRGAKPTNPFHVEEFDPRQITDLLVAAGFAHPEVWGVHHGPAISPTVVARQIGAVLSGEWPQALLEELAAVRAADFEVRRDDLDASLDLIGLGRAPAAQ
jgi:SAM-dependent methyltransferase